MEVNKEIIKHTVATPASTSEQKDFKGYSLEELRYQRAMIALKKEFLKSKMIHELNHIKDHSIFGGNRKDSKVQKFGALTTKLLSGLNYLDYAMVGMSLFGTGKKIYRFFKRK